MGQNTRTWLLTRMRTIGARVLDTAFPPVCLACSSAVADPDGLCPACWQQLRPISAPLCPVLGLPFATAMGKGAVSVEALADPPVFGRARSAVAYTDLARKLVSKLKYSDRPEIAIFCARMMAAAGLDHAKAPLARLPFSPRGRRCPKGG